MKKIFTFFVITLVSYAHAQTYNWTQQTSNTSSNLNDVHFIDNMTGWAVGAGGVILGTTDGGQTWTPQSTGNTDDYRTVFFIDANTGWAATFNPTKLYKTTNGGALWTDITPASGFSMGIQDIAFANTMTGWLVADSIYKTTDGGTTWKGQTVGGSTTNRSYRAVTTTSDSTAYVGGKSKRSNSSFNYSDVFASAGSSSINDFVPNGFMKAGCVECTILA